MPVRKSLNHLPSSPAKIVEEEAAMKEGIVTILRSDCGRSKPRSIRRTLSADMSSKKWLEQNGLLSPMKKIVSSQALLLPADSSSSSSESEEEFEEIPKQDDVWRSIQAQKVREETQKPAKIQVWGSILTQKSENSVLPPPYIHPLVKRSASSLSKKSLQVCTESLGSETGSDCFSCHSCEEREDRERFVAEELKDSNPFGDLRVAKYKKSPGRPFPPPLPSLHMLSHRGNGRLVLEAVSVPQRNYFHAQRQNGRLLLTLALADEAEEYEQVFDNMEEVDEDIQEKEQADGGSGSDDHMEEEEKSIERESEFVMEQNLSLSSGRMIGGQKSGLVMKRLMAVGNINPTWSKADKSITAEEEEVPISPPAPLAAVSSGFINNNQDLVLMKRNKNTEQVLPYLRGCKEARRSLLIWEGPFCISTS